MNYIKQLNAFWKRTMLNNIAPTETALYMAILHCGNISGWKQNLSIPNSTLLNLAKISNRVQLNRLRRKLSEAGLIKYKDGKRGSAGIYTIVCLYDDTNFVSNNDTYSDTNGVTNNDTSSDTSSDTNSVTNVIPYININKNINKTKQNNICADADLSASAPEQVNVVELMLNDKSLFGVTQENIDHWRELYPAVNIMQELRKMQGWLEANPAKRKTRRGINRFIIGWLSKEQDKGYSKNLVKTGESDAGDRRFDEYAAIGWA